MMSGLIGLFVFGMLAAGVYKYLKSKKKGPAQDPGQPDGEFPKGPTDK
jgi:hypothetical protein